MIELLYHSIILSDVSNLSFYFYKIFMIKSLWQTIVNVLFFVKKITTLRWKFSDLDRWIYSGKLVWVKEFRKVILHHKRGFHAARTRFPTFCDAACCLGRVKRRSIWSIDGVFGIWEKWNRKERSWEIRLEACSKRGEILNESQIFITTTARQNNINSNKITYLSIYA